MDKYVNASGISWYEGNKCTVRASAGGPEAVRGGMRLPLGGHVGPRTRGEGGDKHTQKGEKSSGPGNPKGVLRLSVAELE